MRRKIKAAVLALTLVAATMPGRMLAAENYSMTDSFESAVLSCTGEGCSVAASSDSHTGNSAVFVSNRESDDSGAVYILDEIPEKSSNEISVWVKAPVSGEKVRLWVSFETVGGETISGKIAEAQTRKDQWIELRGTLYTKFYSIRGGISLKIISDSGSGPFDYLADDLSVTSDQPSAASLVPEPEVIQDTGKYARRISFENQTTGGFHEQGTVTLEITDDTLPHSGKYSMKVTGRAMSWHTTMLDLDDFPDDAIASVSVWVKTPSGAGAKSFMLQVSGVVSSMKTIATANVPENTWTRLMGTISLKGIERAGDIKLQIACSESGASQFTDFYIDDFLLTSDAPGNLIDDMTETPEEEEIPQEGMSATPYKASVLPVEVQQDIPSLKDVMKDYFKMGTSFNAESVRGDNFSQLVTKHFNVATPQGPFHMSSVRSVDGVYDFTRADAFMDYCMSNDIEVVGHCLIWDHSNQKPYLTNPDGSYISREEAIALMEEHIKTMSEHFNDESKGWKLRGWDVVNEAISDGEQPDVLKDYAGWSTILGEDYLYYAYKFADKYNPDTELYYNDYGLADPVKRQSVYNLIKRLLERGCRIDAIGMQSHHAVIDENSNPYQVRKTIEMFASLGVRVEITELDVGAYTLAQQRAKIPLYDKGLPQSIEDMQTWLWYEYFQIFKDYSDVIDRVTTWGVYDGISYKNSSDFVHVEYPLLFDRNFQAKPAYWAVVNPEEYEKQTGLDLVYQKPHIYNEATEIEIDSSEMTVSDNVLYAPLRKVMDSFGVQIAYSAGDYSITMIKKGKMLRLWIGKDKAELDFEPVNLSGTLEYNEEGAVVAPVKDILELLGYTVRWSEKRNTLYVYDI